MHLMADLKHIKAHKLSKYFALDFNATVRSKSIAWSHNTHDLAPQIRAVSLWILTKQVLLDFFTSLFLFIHFRFELWLFKEFICSINAAIKL